MTRWSVVSRNAENSIHTKNIVFLFSFVSAVVSQFIFLLFISLFDNNIYSVSISVRMARRMRPAESVLSNISDDMLNRWCSQCSCMDSGTIRKRMTSASLRKKRQKIFLAHTKETFGFHLICIHDLWTMQTTRNVSRAWFFRFIYLFHCHRGSVGIVLHLCSIFYLQKIADKSNLIVLLRSDLFNSIEFATESLCFTRGRGGNAKLAHSIQNPCFLLRGIRIEPDCVRCSNVGIHCGRRSSPFRAFQWK